jgi:hypothetical protein
VPDFPLIMLFESAKPDHVIGEHFDVVRQKLQCAHTEMSNNQYHPEMTHFTALHEICRLGIALASAEEGDEGGRSVAISCPGHYCRTMEVAAKRFRRQALSCP